MQAQTFKVRRLQDDAEVREDSSLYH